MAGSDRLDGEMAALAKPEESDFGVSYGTDTSLPFATPYQPEFSKRVPQNDGVLYEVDRYEIDFDGPSLLDLQRMRRRDTQAQALHRLITQPIKSALKSAKFVPAEGGEKEAEFIEAAFFTPPSNGGMEVPFRKVMDQILEAVFMGFSAFEKVYHRPKTGPLKGKTTLQRLGYRPPTTVTFISDANGHFQGIRQRIWSGPEYRDVFIDPKYCFYFAAQEELNKFYGVSFFDGAYFNADKKQKLEYISHLAAQRAAVGTRIGTVPAGASKSDKHMFSMALQNMALSQYLAIPEGFEVEVLKEGGSFDFTSMINYHNAQMSKSVLANFFDKDQSASGGSSLVNFAEPGNDMFVLMLSTIMDDIADAINYFLIPQLVDLNFSGKDKKYPTFVWGDLTDEQHKAVSEMFKSLATAGQSLAITPEFMRAIEEHMSETMGLDIDYEEVDAREEEEQALSEAQFAAEQGISDQGLTGPDGIPLPQAENPTPEEAEASLQELESALGVGEGGTTPPTQPSPTPDDVQSVPVV